MVRATWRDSAPQFMEVVDMTGSGTMSPNLLPEAPGLPGTRDFPDQPSYPDPAAEQETSAMKVR